ncbi:MAG: Dps family protein [Cytophagales bacterium]
MTLKNRIGIDEKLSNELANELNDLLVNLQLFYMNTRGFHWNIKGEKFFELHLKFEELYNDLQLKIDEVAERILTLGETPIHSYTEIIKKAAISEVTHVSNGKKAVESILESFKVLIFKERKILKLSAEADDEGTNALMSDYIRAQEKLVWMYAAYLSE